MRFGVLGVQGDWAAHAQALAELGAPVRPVRTAVELAAVDALVIPGGESSTMLHVMGPERLAQRIAARVRSGMPVLATCAGLILVAMRVDPPQPCLEVLDVDVRRNGYGRQVHSTVARVRLEPEMGVPGEMEGVFIRAPRITRVGAGVRVLGRWRDDVVLVQQGVVIASSFHPELTADRRVHRLFVAVVEGEHGRAVGA